MSNQAFWDKVRSDAYVSKIPYAPFGAGESFERYRDEENRLEAEFKQDMFAHYGVTEHPKADLAYEIALQHVYEPEWGSIAKFFGVLVQLIKD